MAESALSSNETAADRAGGSSPLGQPSVDFAHAVRRSHHARSDASSCEGEEQLPDLRTALTHLHAAATFLANIPPPEYTEVEVAYMRKWFGNELDQFSSSASDFPEVRTELQELRQGLESLSQGLSVRDAHEKSRDPTETVPTVPREPSEVDTSTAQSSVEVDAKLRAV
jgi:hypothetical protein